MNRIKSKVHLIESNQMGSYRHRPGLLSSKWLQLWTW